jgi:hypothetical protein
MWRIHIWTGRLGQCNIWNVTGVAPPKEGEATPDSDSRASSAKGKTRAHRRELIVEKYSYGIAAGTTHTEPSLAQVTQAYEQ